MFSGSLKNKHFALWLFSCNINYMTNFYFFWLKPVRSISFNLHASSQHGNNVLLSNMFYLFCIWMFLNVYTCRSRWIMRLPQEQGPTRRWPSGTQQKQCFCSLVIRPPQSCRTLQRYEPHFLCSYSFFHFTHIYHCEFIFLHKSVGVITCTVGGQGSTEETVIHWRQPAIVLIID